MYNLTSIRYRIFVDLSISIISMLLALGTWDEHMKKDKMRTKKTEPKEIYVSYLLIFLSLIPLILALYHVPSLFHPDIKMLEGTYVVKDPPGRNSLGLKDHRFRIVDGDSLKIKEISARVSSEKVYLGQGNRFIPGKHYRVYYDARSDLLLAAELLDTQSSDDQGVTGGVPSPSPIPPSN